MRQQASLFDIVITSGGVGPTHDDVTIKSVAGAFSQRMVLDRTMLQTVAIRLGVSSLNELQEAQRKMALMPKLAVLRFPSTQTWNVDNDGDAHASGVLRQTFGDPPPDVPLTWPILQCENVFVLPGVPHFFEEKIDMICEHFLKGQQMFEAKVGKVSFKGSNLLLRRVS